MKLTKENLCPGSGLSYAEDPSLRGYPHCHVCNGVVMLTKVGTIYNHRRRIMKSPKPKKLGRPINAKNLCPGSGSYSYISMPDTDGNQHCTVCGNDLMLTEEGAIANHKRKIKSEQALGHITSVTFRANAEIEKFQHVHIEATRTVGKDEKPEQALVALKKFVAHELRIAKGRVGTVDCARCGAQAFTSTADGMLCRKCIAEGYGYDYQVESNQYGDLW